MAISLNLKKSTVVQDPPLARLLFSDKRLAIVWTIVRIFVGYQRTSTCCGCWARPGAGRRKRQPRPPAPASPDTLEPQS